MVIDEFVTQLAGQGLLGTLLCLVGFALYRKDRRCAELQDKRLEDMRSVKDEYILLVKQVNSTLDRLVSLIQGSKGGGTGVR